MTKEQRNKLIIEGLEKEIQEWIDISKDKDYQIYLLEQELKEYRKLKSEVHKSIERVWEYDTCFPLSTGRKGEKEELIEKVFYKIANQWID